MERSSFMHQSLVSNEVKSSLESFRAILATERPHLGVFVLFMPSKIASFPSYHRVALVALPRPCFLLRHTAPLRGDRPLSLASPVLDSSYRYLIHIYSAIRIHSHIRRLWYSTIRYR